MKVGDHPPVDPSEYPRKFREVFVLRPVESAEGMQPKVRNAGKRGELTAVRHPKRQLPLHRLVEPALQKQEECDPLPSMRYRAPFLRRRHNLLLYYHLRMHD